MAKLGTGPWTCREEAGATDRPFLRPSRGALTMGVGEGFGGGERSEPHESSPPSGYRDTVFGDHQSGTEESEPRTTHKELSGIAARHRAISGKPRNAHVGGRALVSLRNFPTAIPQTELA